MNYTYACYQKKINRCPSCEEQIVYVVNEFCRACPKCGRVFEFDDDEQFQEENRERSFTANNFYLKNFCGNGTFTKCFLSAR